MSKLFRVTIIINLTLYVAWFLFPYTYEYWVTDKALNLLYANNFEPLFVGPIYVYWIIFFVNIISLIGMYFFNSNARNIFLWILILNLFQQSISGVSVYTSVEHLIVNLLYLLNGMIVAMVFFTSISGLFYSRKDN